MMNHHTARRVVSAFLFVVVALLAFCTFSGCVGAPKSLDQLEEMPQDDFDAWLDRVGAWSALAAQQVVKDHPNRVEKVLAYAALVETLTSDDPLGDAAAQIGLDEPIAQLLVLEAKALLRERGGLPTGPRGSAVLTAVASGVRRGVGTTTTSCGFKPSRMPYIPKAQRTELAVVR